MRQLAASVAAEDRHAEEVLRDLLSNTARAAWAKLATQSKFRTAGVVRRLLQAANDACEREPLDALTFAEVASEIAERLTEYRPMILAELRGTAWKEQANALRLLGRYDAALDALARAEREFRKAPSAPLGPAMVDYVRAVVHYERGELSRAHELLTST